MKLICSLGIKKIRSGDIDFFLKKRNNNYLIFLWNSFDDLVFLTIFIANIYFKNVAYQKTAHISDQCSIGTTSTTKKKKSEKIKYYPYHPKLVGTILQPMKISQQENNNAKKTTSKCTLL